MDGFEEFERELDQLMDDGHTYDQAGHIIHG